MPVRKSFRTWLSTLLSLLLLLSLGSSCALFRIASAPQGPKIEICIPYTSNADPAKWEVNCELKEPEDVSDPTTSSVIKPPAWLSDHGKYVCTPANDWDTFNRWAHRKN